MKKIILFLFMAFFLSGCGQFFRLTSEYDLPLQSLKSQHQQNKTRVIFYNTSNLVLFGLDFTDKIDIILGGKNLGSIRRKEYIIADLEPKEYELKLTHYDSLMEFSDTYKINVSNNVMFVSVYAGLISTKYSLRKQLPAKFEKKFKAVYKMKE